MGSTNVTNNLSTILFTSSRTFSGWLKPGASSGVVHANGDNNSSRRFRNFYNQNGRLNLDFNGSTLSGSTAPVPGTWFHFSTTFNGTSKLVSQYVNGVNIFVVSDDIVPSSETNVIVFVEIPSLLNEILPTSSSPCVKLPEINSSIS